MATLLQMEPNSMSKNIELLGWDIHLLLEEFTYFPILFQATDLPFVRLPIENYPTLLLLVLSAKYSNWLAETMFEVQLNKSTEDVDGSNYYIV